MTPADAPPYYRLSLDASLLARNTLEYADRAATFGVGLTLIAVLILGHRLLLPLTGLTWRLVIASGVWILGFFSITVFLPVRSSLYACLPSVGSAIVVAALVCVVWQRSTPVRQVRALKLAVVLPLALAPVHIARTSRYVNNAEVSASVLKDLTVLTAKLPERSQIVLHDDRTTRANLASAFGTLLDDAFFFTAGRRMSFWVEPPPPHADRAGMKRPCSDCVEATFALRGRRIERY